MIFLKVFGWSVVFASFFIASIGCFTAFESNKGHGLRWLILGILSISGTMAWIIQGMHWVS